MRQVAAILAATVTLTAASLAAAAPAADGIFFVHGTGDYTPPTSAASVSSPTGGTAISGYWTQDSLSKMSKAPDGTQWSYGVAGYQGATTDARTSWGIVADQLYDYYQNGNGGQIRNVVVVTHSNGSNPIRYLLAHPTATTPKGRSASAVINTIKKVIFLAGDNTGTPLADKVTSAGTIANIGNSILSFFGGSSWNNAAVHQQIQANMTTYNGNGTFALGTSPGGVPAAALYGSNVYAAVWSSDAWCGGYALTTGLKAAQVYGWGSSSAATDGFIGTNSSTYVGSVPYTGDGRLNHNQSRRSCHGVAGNISSQIHAALGGTFTVIPQDYSIAPAAQACNATIQGWSGTSGTPSYTYWYGCTSTMQSNTSTDHDCFVSYGGDNGYVAPSDWASTAYSNTTYYGTSSGCSDSWLGDGICDLCLVAKYGYDAANGGTGPDDCVNYGAGTTNTCYDIAWDGYNNKISYLGYTASH
jgi:hypothetical protein